MWNPWLVGGIIYSSGVEYGKTSPRDESFIPAPKVHAWARSQGGSIPCAPSPTKSPPTEVHAPCHICFCLPGHPGNSQGEDCCIHLGLQCIAEENNPPKRDQPCLLVESIVELRREVGFYLSFTDKEVFWGLELPQEERSSLSVPTAPTADAPGDIDTPDMPSVSEAAPKYARWNTVIHPSWPVVATGETPQLTAMPRVKRRTLQLSRTISISPPPKCPKAPLPPRSPCWPEHWHY